MSLVIVLLLAAVGLWPLPPSTSAQAPSGVDLGDDTDGAREQSVASADSLGRTPTTDASDAVILVALALRSGAALVDSLEIVADVIDGPARRDLRRVVAAHRWGLSQEDAWELLGPGWRPAAIACAAAERAGIAPADLLARAARQIRDEEDEAMASRMQRVGVLLVLPLGAFFLPGFVATTVVPVVLHLLRSAT